jgi:pyruvate dehydrogenase (quinone)
MSRTVAEVLVDVLEQVGVTQIFGLIGDSLNPLGDAVRRSGIEWVGVRHEEGAALAAAGQAKLTGRLAVCAGTTGPGSTHLVAGLYEASRDHAPVLALSGEMPRRLKGIDYHQATEPDLLFRDVSLYTQTITTAAQAPGVIHQAIASAYAGPGVAHLTLPQDVLAGKAKHSVQSVATLRPRGVTTPDEADIEEAARRIDEAEKIVVLCGAGCRGSVELLAIGPPESATVSHHARQGPDALRRRALDGRPRHDREQARL